VLEARHRDWLAGDGIVQRAGRAGRAQPPHRRERWLKVNDDSSGGMTLHELAAEYGVSAERIRQIEVAAMKKMRKALDPPERTLPSPPGGRSGRPLPPASKQLQVVPPAPRRRCRSA
jgi:hypothetical protein